MERFKSLSKEPVDQVEGKILDKWLKEDLLQRCIDERKDAGPQTTFESIP